MIDDDQRRGSSVARWAAYPRLKLHGAALCIDQGNGEILALKCGAAGGGTMAPENVHEYKGEKCARTRPLHPRPA